MVQISTNIIFTLILLFISVYSYANSLVNPFWFGAAAPAFDPSDISGYAVHFIADSLTGDYSDGDAVDSGWASEVGSYDLSTDTGTPTFETNELNGLPIVRFDSGDQLRDLTNTPSLANNFFYVFVVNIASSGDQRFIQRLNAGATYLLKRSDDDLDFVANNGVVSIGTADFDTTPDLGNWMIISWEIDWPSGTCEVYINGTLQGSGSGTTDSTAYGNARLDFPYGANFAADLAEWIIYNGNIPTTQERSDLFDHLADKYNITLN